MELALLQLSEAEVTMRIKREKISMAKTEETTRIKRETIFMEKAKEIARISNYVFQLLWLPLVPQTLLFLYQLQQTIKFLP